MRVRWTADAADDLEQISDYIAEDRPGTARRIAMDIIRSVDALLVLAPLPFIAVYEVHDDEVQILRLLHGAQEWPTS